MDPIVTYQKVFECISNGVIATDAGGNIILINQKALEILKVKEEKVIGVKIKDMFPLTGALVVKCLQTGEPQLGHHVYGKQINLVVNVTPVRESAKLIGTISNFQEMEHFESVAQQLESYKQLNKEFEIIFDSCSDGIWVYDSERKVIRINKAAERIDDIRMEDVIGKTFRELIECGIVATSAVPDVLRTKREVSLIVEGVKKKSTKLITGTPVFDDYGNIKLIVINERDMTQLNRIKEELEESRLITEKYREKLAEITSLKVEDEKIIAKSKEMQGIMIKATKLAKLTISNILILGETGTGKGLLAKFIHRNSKRGKHPFIQINCAALPEALLEAELFGYEKGAFTGARSEGKVGLFELANEGTLFLDEIGELPLSLQAKLLKYLDDLEITRLGGIKSKKIECTIIAATNRDLNALVKAGKLREDLFYRLNAFTIEIPSLRERPEDLLDLITHYLKKYNERYQQNMRISPVSMQKLLEYSFSGNVRELENIIKRCVVMNEQPVIDIFFRRNFKVHSISHDATDDSDRKNYLNAELSAVEKTIMADALKRCRSLSQIAKELGISKPTAFRRMKKYRLSF